MAIATATDSVTPNYERLYWEKARKAFKAGRLDKDGEKTESKIDDFLKERSTPQEARELCKATKQAAGEEYSASLGGILEKIEIAMQVGDLAIKSAPESVGLAWMGIRLCLHSVADDFSTFSIFGQACSDIIGIMISCAVFGKMYGPSRGVNSFHEIHSQVTDRIPKVYTEILDFSYSVKKHMGHNKAYRIGKGLLVQASTRFEAKIKSIKNHDTTMAEFARRAYEQLSDYYLRTGLTNQEAMMGDLTKIKSKMEMSLRINQDNADQMRVLIDEIKKRKEMTPHDVAVKNYEENMKQFGGSSDQKAVYAAKISRRSPPQTCTWIFDMELFKSWYVSEKSSVLWVSGGGGFGKSILMSAIINELQDRAKDTGAHVQYFFCNAGDESTKRTDRILKHLLYQMYSLLEHHSTEALEKANKLVSNFLKNRSTSSKESKGDNKKDDVDFAKVFRGLVGLVGKPIFIVVDALDECIDRSEGLLSSLKYLVDGSTSNIKLAICSRPEADIETAFEQIPRIKVEGNNGPDIKLNAQSELARLPGLTSHERATACDKIVEKAGSLFRYVELAVRFLKQPWQRPLERHLEQLPIGLEAAYEQTVRNIDPAYLELLKTCLTWTCLAEGQIRVPEVIDAYSRKYVVEQESHEAGDVESIEEPEAQEDLHVDQIRTAGSAFLEVDSMTRVIQLRHATVADYFLGAKPEVQTEEQCLCKNCTRTGNSQKSFALSEKHGHLTMATTILKHLSCESFRQEFLVSFERRDVKETVDTHDKSGEEEEQQEQQQQNDESEAKNVNTNDGDMTVEPTQSSELPPSGTEDGKSSEEPINTGNTTTDQSSEKEQDAESEIASATDSDADIDPLDPVQADSDDVQDPGARFRYEIHYFQFHMCKVEELWEAEDRKGPEWEEYEALQDSFFVKDSPFFQSWINLKNQAQGSAISWIFDIKTIHPIHIAAAYGLTSLAGRLIERGADLAAVTDEGYTALDFAVEHYGFSKTEERAHKNVLRLLELLLKAGSDPNNLDKRTARTPFLRLFWQNPKIEAIQIFLDNGADAKGVDLAWGAGSLHYCCGNCDDPAVLKALLAAGADPNLEDNSGETPLHFLMMTWKQDSPLELVDIMISGGANVNAEDKTGQRPLYELCWSGNVEVAKILIKNGADVTDDDVNKITALHMACRAGNTDLVLLLIEHGAQMSAVDDRGCTPLYYSCEAKTDTTALALIDRLGTDGLTVLGLANSDGKSPIRKAAARGHHKIVEALFEKLGLDIAVLETQDKKQQWTPLHAAAHNGQKEVVEFILSKGVNINILDRRGDTPLKTCLASWRDTRTQDYEFVALKLLDADPSKISGTELLHSAAIRGNLAVLNKLMDKGADPLLQDEHGWTSVQVARQCGQDEAASLLSSKRAVTGIRPSGLVNTLPKIFDVSGDGTSMTAMTKKCEGSLLANHPIPAGIDGFYYEIEVDCPNAPSPDAPAAEEYPEVALGLCPHTARTRGWLPGRSWPRNPAWGYHGDDGSLWPVVSGDKPHAGLHARGHFIGNFGHADVVGCGIDFTNNKVFYTKNGELLRTLSQEKPPTHYAFAEVTGRLYPVVGTSRQNLTIKVNFGGDLETKPYKWTPGNATDCGSKYLRELEEDLIANPPKVEPERPTSASSSAKAVDEDGKESGVEADTAVTVAIGVPEKTSVDVRVNDVAQVADK
ncbi:hypothetical protein EJ05DRAFT_496790 [Pseudovirgaria hyperparasitica]|uniref:B30.2/SPRY domain-containing protein n=1 Tax=Pseudovirgaria hyperparasitica TaxID=470096 RepID=A0A6A6WGC8_9PEZI|nr:uncharacterized protein EJ05DRAFT_496790 [Pseudovirgaria hyperparasitica]KAF2761902.1 hypothetical protein EJ05DRAFT_496790 [Pseudovirgaria hyperparasitica]